VIEPSVGDSSFAINIKDAIAILVFVLGLSAAWWKLTEKINGHGKRTTEASDTATKAYTLAEKLLVEFEGARQERIQLRERIVTVEANVVKLGEELSEERLAVMTTLHNNERAASERDATLREQLAVLNERMNIDRIVRTVVREFHDNPSSTRS